MTVASVSPCVASPSAPLTGAAEEGGCDELMVQPRSSDVKSWSLSVPGGVFSISTG